MGEGPRGIGLRGGPLLLSQLETGLRKCGTRGSQGTAWRDGHRVPADEATGAPEKLPSSPHACRAMRPLGRSLRGLREDPPRYLSATSGSLRLPSAAHADPRPIRSLPARVPAASPLGPPFARPLPVPSRLGAACPSPTWSALPSPSFHPGRWPRYAVSRSQAARTSQAGPPCAVCSVRSARPEVRVREGVGVPWTRGPDGSDQGRRALPPLPALSPHSRPDRLPHLRPGPGPSCRARARGPPGRARCVPPDPRSRCQGSQCLLSDCGICPVGYGRQASPIPSPCSVRGVSALLLSAGQPPARLVYLGQVPQTAGGIRVHLGVPFAVSPPSPASVEGDTPIVCRERAWEGQQLRARLGPEPWPLHSLWGASHVRGSAASPDRKPPGTCAPTPWRR